VVLAEPYAFFPRFKYRKMHADPSSPATSAFPAFLNRRAGHRPERTEHAAIAGQWLELLSAAFADMEELTGIGRHLFDGLKTALRTGENGFELHRYLTGPVT
jgi:hypothetical protein